MSTAADSPPTILVVDDEPDVETLIRQRFRQRVRQNEVQLLFARNGAEALRVLEAHPDVAVVLTDINMPEMDGLTLLGHLRERNGLLKAVVISAYGDMENIRTAMNRGAFDFVTKPIDFRDLDITIVKTLGEVRALRRAAEAHDTLVAIEQELSVARTIQQSMLPKNRPFFPPESGVDVDAVMVPAREVSGDFYDFFFVDNHRLGLAVGDVTGKGVPAALLMAVTRTITRSTALSEPNPARCMEKVNQLLFEESQSDMFVTLFYGVFDTRTGRLDFCSAGHNPPYLLQQGAPPKPLDPVGGLVLAIEGNEPYEGGGVVLKPGDALFLYTDGITEAMAPDGQFYTTQRLEATLRNGREPDSSGLIRHVVDDVKAFMGDAPQSDDITAVALRYLGPPTQGAQSG